MLHRSISPSIGDMLLYFIIRVMVHASWMDGDEVFFVREDDWQKRPSVWFHDWSTKRMLHLEPIKETFMSFQPIRYKTTFAHTWLFPRILHRLKGSICTLHGASSSLLLPQNTNNDKIRQLQKSMWKRRGSPKRNHEAYRHWVPSE